MPAPVPGTPSWNFREAAREAGWDLSAHPDDATAFNALRQAVVRTAQEALQHRQAAEQYQQFAPYRSEFEHFIQMRDNYRREQAQQQQAKQSQWWNPPPFDPRWMDGITQDPQTGAYSVKPGYPPDTLNKIMAFRQHQQQTMERLAQNPLDVIRPGIEPMMNQLIEQKVQERLGGYTAKVYADNFIGQNSGWIFNRDASGRPIPGSLSPEGRQFQAYVQQLEASGVTDVRAQTQIASQMLRADVASRQLAAAAARPGSAATAPAVAPPQTQGGGINRIAQVGQQAAVAGVKGVGLKERLNQAFDANGITDNDIRASANGRR